jgi:hypothetical protein
MLTKFYSKRHKLGEISSEDNIKMNIINSALNFFNICFIMRFSIQYLLLQQICAFVGVINIESFKR